MSIERLREIREDKDLKQKDIAAILKITQQMYSEYELGIRIIPLEKLCILAEYYNTSLDYLVGLTNERKPYKRI